MGKANTCSCSGKCIGIVGDWTPKSGHKSYIMYACFELMRVLMHVAVFGLTPLLWHVYEMYNLVRTSVICNVPTL